MAETQVASIGWGGMVRLHNGTALAELMNVTGFKPPYNTRERVDATHLKSAGRRRQMIAGLFETTTIGITLHYRPNSDTDALLRAAVAAGNSRAAEFTIPEDGDPNVLVTCNVVVLSYEADDVEVDGVMTATAEFEIVGDITQTVAP
jgi:predicted secreted protein